MLLIQKEFYEAPINNYKQISLNELCQQTPINSPFIISSQLKKQFQDDENLQLYEVKECRTKIIQRRSTEQLPQDLHKFFNFFYNADTISERDISVAVVNQFLQELASNQQPENILCTSAGSAMRALRYAKEIRCQKQLKILAQENNPKFVKYLDLMKELNKIPENLVIPVTEDLETYLASLIVQQSQEKLQTTQKDNNNDDDAEIQNDENLKKDDQSNKFRIIDLEPHRNTILYVDSALRHLNNQDGLLCLSFADLENFIGPNTDRGSQLYGSVRTTGAFDIENSIRMLLYTVNTIATRRELYIQPLLCFPTQNYMRLFLRVKKSQSQSAQQFGRYCYIIKCERCSYNYSLPCCHLQSVEEETLQVPQIVPPLSKCPQCDSNLRLYGPVWGDLLYDVSFVKKMQHNIEDYQFDTESRVQNMFYHITVHEQRDPQFSKQILGVSIKDIFHFMKFTKVPRKQIVMRALLRHSLAYRFVPSYIDPQIYKINFPQDLIFDLARHWRTAHYQKTLKPKGQQIDEDELQNSDTAVQIYQTPRKNALNFNFRILDPSESEIQEIVEAEEIIKYKTKHSKKNVTKTQSNPIFVTKQSLKIQ